MPSTVISHMEYDKEKALLTIQFVSGLVYQYLNVPEEVYTAFRQYREKGVFLNKFIRGKYEYRKVDH